MTNHVVETLYQDSFSACKEQSKIFIDQSDLMRPDGSVNEGQIFALAQQDAGSFIEAFHRETVFSLARLLNQKIADDNWMAVTNILSIHFYVMNSREPVLFKVLTAHDEAYQAYCRSLCQCLSETY